jgi:hypothetical protein
MKAQGSDVVRIDGEAAAGGDDLAGCRPELGAQFGFKPTEEGFTVLGKDLTDLPALSLLDDLVRVDEFKVEELCEERSDRGFARAHETYQGNVAMGTRGWHGRC